MLSDHLAALQASLVGISRTANSGSVDVSASPEKALLYSRADVDSYAVDTAMASAVEFLERLTPSEISVNQLSEVNSLIKGDGTGGGFRTFEVSRYGYLPHSQIGSHCAAFIERLRAVPRGASWPAVCTAMFDVHWCINLKGHYFSDGCGRTATVIGGWVSDWMSGDLFVLPARSQYLEVADAENPLERWTRACREAADLG